MYSMTVSRVLDLVSKELDPYIQERLTPYLGGLHWINILQQLDDARGKNTTLWAYKSSDLSMQLRVLTERLGNLGYPFDSQDRNRTCSSYGSVLRLIRNRWAHNDEFQAFDALQAIEISYALLIHIGANETASEISDIRTDLLDSLGKNENPGAGPVEPDTRRAKGERGGTPEKKPENPSSTTLGYVNDCEEWQRVIIGEQSELDSMRSVRTREMVRSLIEDIVDVEGPVSPARVARLVGQAFGFSRLSRARIAQITRQFQNAEIAQDKNGFLWPRSITPENWRIFRTLGHRDFLEISPHELANALDFLCDSENKRDSPDKMRKELLKLYGRQRETAETRKHLDSVISNLQSR